MTTETIHFALPRSLDAQFRFRCFEIGKLIVVGTTFALSYDPFIHFGEGCLAELFECTCSISAYSPIAVGIYRLMCRTAALRQVVAEPNGLSHEIASL